jgi:hypothetical protein
MEMSYRIAIASSDEKQIDETFGAARRFHIYEVNGYSYRKTEERKVDIPLEIPQNIESASCSDSVNCGSGCLGGGCGGQAENSSKVELISDCRCVVCKKIGFPIQKQLERKAISVFDVSCSVKEALNKIVAYYKRIDNHESLKK